MLSTVLLFALVVAIGLCVGTWIDAAAAAIPAHRSPWRLPACPECETPWWGLALIPLVGPLFVRRCPNCEQPITRFRPLTEATTASLFALALWRAGLTVEFGALTVFTV